MRRKDKNMNEITIIRIRRGYGNTRYCACDDSGNPIQGFYKLSDIRKRWQNEIKWGYVKLVRELDKTPNMEIVNRTIKLLERILIAYADEAIG